MCALDAKRVIKIWSKGLGGGGGDNQSGLSLVHCRLSHSSPCSPNGQCQLSVCLAVLVRKRTAGTLASGVWKIKLIGTFSPSSARKVALPLISISSRGVRLWQYASCLAASCAFSSWT